MGRQRKFDLDQALEVATELFWRKGYDQTSLQDLTAAMGISAPSFYFAFGSKEALFKRVAEAYRHHFTAGVLDAFSQPTAREVIARLFDGLATFLTDASHPPGCLIMNNALPLVETHPFRSLFAEQREAFRASLQERLEEAKAEEEGLPETFDPEALSRLIAIIMWGFAVSAQSGATLKNLLQAKQALLDLWPN